jgi:hypothetical protein
MRLEAKGEELHPVHAAFIECDGFDHRSQATLLMGQPVLRFASAERIFFPNPENKLGRRSVCCLLCLWRHLQGHTQPSAVGAGQKVDEPSEVK